VQKVFVIHKPSQDWQAAQANIGSFETQQLKGAEAGMGPATVGNDSASPVVQGQGEAISQAMGQPLTRYGKVNFKNMADKEVKIYEISGIGEPTVLSPKYVSTFFVKSPKSTATFKAMDPGSSEGYLLNGKEQYEIQLNENPKAETDVLISKSDTAKREHENNNPACAHEVDPGLCYTALTYETQVEAAEGKSEVCKKYLEEVLSKCSQRNVSHTIEECQQHCNAKDSEVCQRVWNPTRCTKQTTTTRYAFTSSKCEAFQYGGCLGNENNFATPEACSRTCSPSDADTKQTRNIRNAMEERIRKVINRSRLMAQLAQLR